MKNALAPIRLFVYGTLKRGFCRHPALSGERFLGTAHTAPEYQLVNVGTYPGLLEGTDIRRSIQGEVWEIRPDTLSRLDKIEGVDEGLYVRRPIALQTPEFGRVEAYFYACPADGLPDCGESWQA
jgi:gamma-glutamylcyclotransferase (GGCT)/AIG2-like uncharacterized protein YtfP